MNLPNFYPGPSRVYSNIPEYLYDAYRSGILGANHRSKAGMQLVEATKEHLKKKLSVPQEYEIAFVSSATENWEIIAQSLTDKGSLHFYNGAFGEKWYRYASELTNAVGVKFGINEALPVNTVSDAYDVLCITQNETSNGTQVGVDRIADLRKRYPNHLIAVDATSSMSGVKLDFNDADYWYASVQKCFGLPAGMAVVILSPLAVERAYELGDRKRYNSLINILENTRKNQTHYTPNVLGIYLMKRTLEVSKGIEVTEAKLQHRYSRYDELFEKLENFSFLVKNKVFRSKTVLAIRVENPEDIINQAENAGIILGAGYGSWKSDTIRIANFPAIKTREVDKLISFMVNRFT